jgi:hypothetical protein
MKPSILFFILILSQTTYSQKKDINSIKSIFSNYQQLVENKKGSEAVSFVDSKTLDYYGKIASLAIYGDSAKIQSLEYLEKVNVLSIRHKFQKDKIVQIAGRGELFITLVNEGSLAGPRMEITDVIVNGNSAQATITIDEEKQPYYFLFNKEGGQWKIDATSDLPTLSEFYKTMYPDKEAENKIIFFGLKLLTGKPAESNIWNPIK